VVVVVVVVVSGMLGRVQGQGLGAVVTMVVEALAVGVKATTALAGQNTAGRAYGAGAAGNHAPLPEAACTALLVPEMYTTRTDDHRAFQSEGQMEHKPNYLFLSIQIEFYFRKLVASSSLEFYTYYGRFESIQTRTS